MSRDIFTLVTFGVMSIFIVLGYQNFAVSNFSPTDDKNCQYAVDFKDLKDIQNFTPIIYTLENQKIWKGQSGAGPFQMISPEYDIVLNFRVIESGKIEALVETEPMEYSLKETKDSGETWSVIANISESELNSTVDDTIEFQNQIYVAAKFLNGDRTYLRIMTRSMTATKWNKLKDIEIDQDSVSAFGKDQMGNLYLAYNINSQVYIERRSGEGNFSRFSKYNLPLPWFITPSSFMGIATDRNNNVRVFVNVADSSATKPANTSRVFVLTFYDSKKIEKVEISNPSNQKLTGVHMAISEDGTISVNGVQKVSAAGTAENFLRINHCN